MVYMLRSSHPSSPFASRAALRTKRVETNASLRRTRKAGIRVSFQSSLSSSSSNWWFLFFFFWKLSLNALDFVKTKRNEKKNKIPLRSLRTKQRAAQRSEISPLSLLLLQKLFKVWRGWWESFCPRVVLSLGFLNFLGVVVCVFVLKNNAAKRGRSQLYLLHDLFSSRSLSLSRSLCFFILCDWWE